MFTINIPRIRIRVKPGVPTAHDIAAGKVGRKIAYYNAEGRPSAGHIFDFRFDGAGILSYAVWTGSQVDFVSSWNFIGEVA